MHTGKPEHLEGHLSKFYLDSGASGHYIPDLEYLHNLHMYKVLKNIQMASGAYVQAKGVGTLKFEMEDKGGIFVGKVLNIEWTPDARSGY
jgi:hypothetical protein